ncbi:MAG: DNA primase [Acholeplasmataceae bacterium]
MRTIIDDKLIREINEKTDIVELVSEYIELERVGKNYKGLCPFHDDTNPSFSVSPEKNIAMCMTCKEGGRPITFLRKIKNISFQEAALELASRAGIEVQGVRVEKDPNEKFYALMREASLFYQFNLKNSKGGEKALDYLTKREVQGATLEHFQIGYATRGDALYRMLKDKGYAVSDMIALGLVGQGDDGKYYDHFGDRVIFPVTDPKGHVVGFSGRVLSAKDRAKYINSPETVIFRKGKLLYHFHEALPEIRKNGQVVLYEGFFDVISSYNAGIKHGIATMGTALTKDQARLIKSATDSVVIAYDGDEAGLKASDQAITILDREKLKTEVLEIPEKMDPDDFIKAYGPEAYEARFGEHTKDGYAFRYDYYRSGSDFDNANDRKTFRSRVQNMIRYADPAVKDFYQKKLARDLNLDLKDVAMPRVDRKVPPKKAEKKTVTDRYNRAELNLILMMIRSKDTALAVHRKLKATDYADHIAGTLRMKIESFYVGHDAFDEAAFVGTLSEEERTYFEERVKRDFLYQLILDTDESEVDRYIATIKQANMKRRIDYLNRKIKEDPDNGDGYAKERDDLRRELKRIAGITYG